MKAKKHFLQILFVEMEDLQEDIDDMITHCRELWEKRRTTERVYRSNTSLFQNEIMGIEEFKHIVQTTRADQFESLEELKLYLQKELEALIQGEGLAPAISSYINRKIAKVTSYVTRKNVVEAC